MLNCVCVCARMCSSRMMMGLCFCFVFKLPVFIHVLTTTVLPHATSRYSNAVPNPHPLTLCVEPYSSDTYPASSEKQKHVRLNLVPANVRMFTYFYNKKNDWRVCNCSQVCITDFHDKIVSCER